MKYKVDITAYWTKLVEAETEHQAKQLAANQVKLIEAEWTAKTEVYTDENE
jgi:hypothetical protein